MMPPPGAITAPGLVGVTVIVTVLEHPLMASVTEYTVIAVGLAVTLEPVEEDKPVEGLQI
jgi:hypothetical protein